MVKTKTKIEKQSKRKGSQELVDTIRAAKKTGEKTWLGIAGLLSGPRRNRIAVNLDEIEKMTKEGDSVLIPGKVLGQGEISKKIAIVAFGFSEKARERLLKTKSQAITIIEEIKKNPGAKGFKILIKENEKNN